MRYHDTHFHLDLMASPEEAATIIEQNQVYTIAVTNSPSVFFYTEKIASNKKFIRPALGLHPELAYERFREVDQFKDLVSKTKYIGEIGLDNKDKSPQDYQKQIDVFERLISICADEGNKVLTIHSRRAAKDVLDILGDKFPGKVILHWYSDSMKHLETALDRGYFFSVNYPMLHSKSGQKIIQTIPHNRILIETDGPFTKYGDQVFDPSMTKLITDGVVSLVTDKNEPSHVRETILGNFKTLIT